MEYFLIWVITIVIAVLLPHINVSAKKKIFLNCILYLVAILCVIAIFVEYTNG